MADSQSEEGSKEEHLPPVHHASASTTASVRTSRRPQNRIARRGVFEIASGAATMVLEKLAIEAYQEIVMALGLKNDVERLQYAMIIINAFLSDAENKQAKSSGMNEWLQQLRHVFLDASDVFDEIECEALRNEVVEKYGGVWKKFCRFFSSSNQIVFSTKMAHKIREIRERIDDSASLMTKFGLVDNYDAPDFCLSKKMPQRETCSVVVPSYVIGRDEEKEKIIDFLISRQSLDNGVDVIPIVGMGGLGKTTLAKLVYNDERVKRHFDLQAWVCVSDEFDVKRIALEILKSLGREGSHDDNFQQVQSRLHNELHQKKFLIVIDGVWNVDREKWQELTKLLVKKCTKRNKNGCKIIITTRDKKVASITRTASTPQFNLRELNEDECLKVFLRQAFREGDAEKYPRLVKIGKEIVKKCKGVPLAVASLGSLLYFEVNESEWKRVRDSEIWESDELGDGILSALKLSYNHLPPQLKQCVSYCSIFPKGYEYSKEELIHFWLAHGLLQPSKPRAEPEDLGEYYIKELFSRFFFRDLKCFDRVPWSYNFKLHDLIHDLAMSTMQSELAVVTLDSASINEEVRHLAVSKNGEQVPHFSPLPRKVWTFGLWPASERENIITEQLVTWICHQFKFLRVLDLKQSQLKLLPDCFDKMKHLRYLDLSLCSKMEELPESICQLQNLQMLDVPRCQRLKKLPKNMKYLVSLRVLYVTTQERNLSNCGIWCLESLQTLYFIGCKNLVSLPCGLSRLTSLKKLFVSACPELVSFEEEQEEKKEHIEVEDLSLRVLSIDYLPKLTALPHWLERSAKNMQYVDISFCSSLTALPEWMSNLAALEKLAITECPQLVGPDCPKIQHVPDVILEEVKE